MPKREIVVDMTMRLQTDAGEEMLIQRTFEDDGETLSDAEWQAYLTWKNDQSADMPGFLADWLGDWQSDMLWELVQGANFNAR